MPALDFKGKSFIYTHHLGVPYRELLVVPEKSVPAPGGTPDLDGNLILHGDNLEALKALLPRYAGRVDCIYIDPPYNTGTEGWCYNDAVNAPLMREWLKKEGNPVEREDLQRHDKWLCMMWPRLQLLKELLAEDGAIFVSIDDNEVHRLRSMMDEIFGEENFVATVIWEKIFSTKNTARQFSESHEYVLAYAKHSAGWFPHLQERGEEQTARYRNPDNDPRGPWTSGDCSARNYYSEGTYRLTCPSGRVIQGPPPGMYWRFSKRKFDELNADRRIWWGEDGGNVPRFKRFLTDVKSGLTPHTLWLDEEVGNTQEAKKELLQIMPCVGRDAPLASVEETSVVREHAPLEETAARPYQGNSEVFITPKPSRLIQRILEIATDKDSLILDSFAGSGTTAHAVLALNAKDGGQRRFILCETEDYADTLTAERVRRVIGGYGFTGTAETELMPPERVTWSTFHKDKARNSVLERIAGIEALEAGNYDKIEKKIEDGVLTVVGKKSVKERMPGLGGSFTYVELGERMDLERLLAETPGTLPGFASLARYLFHTATGHTLATAADALVPGDAPTLIGETSVWRIYLHYRPDETWLRAPAAAFTRTQAEALAAANKGSGKQVLVFAPAKFISHKSLRELSETHKVRLDFAQLPYALHRVQGE